jgi:hypothetical protein
MARTPSSHKPTKGSIRTKGAANIVAERKSRPLPRLKTPTFLSLEATGEIAAALTTLLPDNDAPYVEPADMLAELLDDNKQLAAFMRQTHDLCDDHDDGATESLLEEFIDRTEKRIWPFQQRWNQAGEHQNSGPRRTRPSCFWAQGVPPGVVCSLSPPIIKEAAKG